MISICYDSSVPMMRAEGHAGFAPFGEDIVCAGVSALLETLALYADCREDGDVFELSGGDARYYDFVAEGILQISEIYPENVIITYGDGDI